MSDSTLRALERAYRSTGAPEARARYLLALRRCGQQPAEEDLVADLEHRVRSKALDPDRVLWAWRLGSRAAAFAGERLGLRGPSRGWPAKLLTDSEARDAAAATGERLLEVCPHRPFAEDEVRAALAVARGHASGQASWGQLAAAHERMEELLRAPQLSTEASAGPRWRASRWRRAVVSGAHQATRPTAAVALGGVLQELRLALGMGARGEEAAAIDAASRAWSNDLLCQYLLELRTVERILPPRQQLAVKKAARAKQAAARAREREEARREAEEIAAEERADDERRRRLAEGPRRKKAAGKKAPAAGRAAAPRRAR